MGRVNLTTGRLALLGRWSLGLGGEAGLLLDELRAPFGLTEIGRVRPDETNSITRAEWRWQWSFWAPYKGVNAIKEQELLTSSGGNGRVLHPTCLWTAELKTLACTEWIHTRVYFGRMLLWELGRAVGPLLGIPGWYRRVRVLANTLVLRSLWPWHWESGTGCNQCVDV